MPTPHSEDKLIGDQIMNYEVNSFQNYESITIDELKDQQSTESGNGRTATAARMHE